jgi:hypothetical protein
MKATVTDAVLGNIDASTFAEGRLEIDETVARSAIAKSVCARLDLAPVNAAHGISQMVSENMANAGRVHAAERGTGLAERTMIAFGGNGPLHATRVAEKMGVTRIIVPAQPGVGSAVGFLSAPISYEIVSSLYTRLGDFDFVGVNQLFDKMAREARAVVNVGKARVNETRTAFMRYAGQGHEIEVALPARPLVVDDLPALAEAYGRAYREQFKRTVPGMRVEIMNWAVRIETHPGSEATASPVARKGRPTPAFQKPIYFGDRIGIIQTSMIYRDTLKPGDSIDGPALIVEPQTSTLVEPAFNASVDGARNLVLTRRFDKDAESAQPSSDSVIDRQLTWNRLLAVVEEQAQALIRSAFSPIVRECGDISAGIFDRKGRMLAQALTGTPGHINTMASGVANFIEVFPLDRMKPGDIYVTNDPWLAAGHLNDFMLVQPVFRQGEVVGFTSCTSHLVDVGGKCMGPEGTDIYDEGVRIPLCRLMADGEIDRTLLGIVKANSRHPIENEGDLYALISCCEVGAHRLLSMMDEFGLASLDSLADHIIETSRRAAVSAIAALPEGTFEHAITLDGYDFEIELNARLTIAEKTVKVDFSGSSPCSSFGINVPLNYVEWLQLDQNENYASASELALVAARDACACSARYPEPDATTLRGAGCRCGPTSAIRCHRRSENERLRSVRLSAHHAWHGGANAARPELSATLG